MDKRTCSIEGCERPYCARGWCKAHYGRWMKDGHPGPAEIGYPGSRITSPIRCAVRGCRKRKSQEAGGEYCREHSGLPERELHELCTVDGCDQPHTSHGFCAKHRYRFLRYGDPSVTKQRYGTGDDVSYIGAHDRIRTSRGPASEHTCVDCGRQALDWSYIYGDENEKWEPKKGPYSTNPEFYAPRCRDCHTAFDHKRSPRRAGWKVQRT